MRLKALLGLLGSQLGSLHWLDSATSGPCAGNCTLGSVKTERGWQEGGMEVGRDVFSGENQLKGRSDLGGAESAVAVHTVSCPRTRQPYMGFSDLSQL